MPLVLTARWILPVSMPPIEHGVVVIDGGRIVGVYAKGHVTADRDFGNAAILPGLVNAHTHLDLSGARSLIPPAPSDRFTDWLRAVIAFRRARTAQQTDDDIRTGIAESIRFGTTLVGDISSGGLSGPWLNQSAIRSVIFQELIGLSKERFHEILCTAQQNERPDTDRTHWRLSPHAPYTVNHGLALPILRRGAGAAIHLGESPGEIELLTSKTGPFVEFLAGMGLWNPDHITASLDEFVAAGADNLIVHGNFIDPRSLTPRHTVCYCPRTHAAFGHPPYPLREFLARGATICLGTDSLASNPDLDLLAEARLVHEQFGFSARSRAADRPERVNGAAILAMITVQGARALGFDHLVGTIEPGKRADLAVIPLADADGDPHELVFFSDLARSRVSFVDGIERTAISP